MGKQNLFDTIQNIEKLYMKLMIEYNFELQRAQNLGLFTPETIQKAKDEDTNIKINNNSSNSRI